MFANLFQQIQDFWQNQSIARRITLIALLASAVIIIVAFTVWASQPSYAVAYSGLNEKDAGEITSKLQEQNIDYKLKDAGTILVQTDKVYEARLAMAREGLPKASTVGYELFSSNSLVMTEFTQQVNYQRALEGELERTIGSLAAVEAVRVHVVIPEKTLLTEQQEPTTASVTLKVKEGEAIDAGQVRAITHLLSSSVEGLKAENVVIVDAEGNMLAGGDLEGPLAVASQTDAHRAAELRAAADIRKKVQDLLTTVLGPNRSVVQVSVNLDWTQRERTTQSFDPAQAAIRSSQKTDETYTSNSGNQGIPGAQTNLPLPEIAVGDNQQIYDYSRSEETTNYEVTEINSHEVESPGAIKKISLAVLVDGIEDTAQLDVLKTAVAAAAGIDEVGRGDMLAVDTLAFDRSASEAQAAEEQQKSTFDLIIQIAQILVPILIVAGLLIFLWRLFKNLRLASEEAWTPVMQPVTDAALGAPQQAQALIGAGVAAPAEGLEEGLSMPAFPEGETLGGFEVPEHVEEEALPEYPQEEMEAPPPALPPLPKIKTTITPEDEQLTRVLTRLAEESPATVAEIIQLWLNEDEK